MGCHCKFVYKALNHTAPKWITLKLTIAAKSSCEISALLRYYAVLGGNSSPTFWDKVLVPLQGSRNPEETVLHH